ncbi:MAG: ATP synthase F0 subunit B [Bdellovibrionota bacterium]
MEILKSLGVDSTIWIHLACFLVSYIALTQLILKPYMAAMKEREKRTLGSEETAVRIIEEANDLHAEYEKRAREVNSTIKGLYDQSRTTATKEYDRLVEAARSEVGILLDASRTQIGAEVQTARRTLSGEIPNVATAIASKLAGKEISL